MSKSPLIPPLPKGERDGVGGFVCNVGAIDDKPVEQSKSHFVK
jgi:hypothetical protein